MTGGLGVVEALKYGKEMLEGYVPETVEGFKVVIRFPETYAACANAVMVMVTVVPTMDVM